MIDSLYRFLAGLGYTDPLHAPITHFPIGLIFGALIFFLVAIIFNRSRLVLTARHASILAFIMVFPTILFGVFDWLHFYNGALIDAIKYKMGLAAFVLVVLAVGIIVGNEVKLRTWVLTGVYILAFLAVVGLGWFGASLVYTRGTTLKVSSAEAAAPALSQAAVQAGQSIFTANCQACHLGGGNVVALNLPLKSSKQLASLPTFVSFIRAPKTPNGSSGAMPAFGSDLISDSQASDLYRYIESMVQTSWK